MYEYRQIIFRLRQKESIRAISRSKVADRKKVRKVQETATEQGWLNKEQELPSDEILAQFFKPVSSKNAQPLITPYKKQIEEWFHQNINAKTIHSTLVAQHNYTGSYNSVQRYIKKLKSQTPLVTTILEFKPGECAQVDFGAGPKLIDETTGEITKTWIFVMVLAWSRHMYAEIILHQDIETWLSCHRHAFEWFGGVVAKVTIDNPKCAITKACYRAPQAQRSYCEFAQGYNFIISPCPPYDPQKKVRVESAVKYIKNSFVPLRKFRNLTDANEQLKKWVQEIAGNRIHGSTREKPFLMFQTEKLFLKKLPDNPPELATWQKVILHNDCHVQFLKCRYSAPYRLIKEILWLRATINTVRIYYDDALIALHPRLFKAGTKSTLQEHLPPNALAYLMRDPQWCLEQAKRIGKHCEQVIQQLLNHTAIDYLRAAQGIVGLLNTYGDTRLNAACQRALIFQSANYKTIKSILQSGLEFAPLPLQNEFNPLTETYTGKARFCRNTSTLLQ